MNLCLIDFDYFLDVKNPIKQLQDADKILQLKSYINLFVGDVPSTIKFLAGLTRVERACIL